MSKLEELEGRIKVLEDIIDVSEDAQFERKFAKIAHKGLRAKIEEDGKEAI